MNESRGRLPIEFDLLDYRPESFSGVDLLAIETEFRWYLTGRFPVIVLPELARRRLGDGPLLEDYLRGEQEGEAILPAGLWDPPPGGDSDPTDPVGAVVGDPDQAIGSNNWVIGGKLSDSGLPVLASDPHIAFGSVSCWYQVHLIGAGFNVAGSGYADLSDTALHYIGGIMAHAKSINAFVNPTTNSYKRLIPGFEAPVLLAYSARNRSASCRIPFVTSAAGKRVEVRFPDPACNPYLGFAAMLMAGLDGIQNKIDPGDAIDKDLYDLPPEELAEVPTVCGSLREALDSLDADRDYLKKGDVFTDDTIDGYMELKWEEVYTTEHAPHPVEFMMYYSC